MFEKIGFLRLSGFSFILLNGNGWHMKDDWPHMMHWWGIPYFGY